LEWNFFARHRFFGLPAHGCVGPRSEELDPLRYDLRALPLAAAVLALKFPRLQPAFNVDLPSFAEILRTGFSKFSENHNIVPLIWNDQSTTSLCCFSFFFGCSSREVEAAERPDSTVDHTDIRGSA
jgi:hypothetical protein